MKRVRKSQPEPDELADYRARFAAAPRPPTWKEFAADPRRREPVKTRLREDQRGLCAYCENRLMPEDESVEHFVSRVADHSLELHWSNLLLCCKGGEKPLPGNVPNDATRYDPQGPRTCGHAKLGSPLPILNPLQIPAFPRLFRLSSESGEIQPDEEACRSATVDVNMAAQTITVLGLHAGRLSRARLAILEELESQLASDGTAPAFSTDRAWEIAIEQIPAAGTLPAFFTTIRWFLGPGAEAHLTGIAFQG
jgi:uncharacterized protein (TIGR02646 family)